MERTGKRNKSCNLFFTYRGETKSLKEWSRETGISYITLYYRYCVYVCDPERMLEKHPRGHFSTKNLNKHD